MTFDNELSDIVLDLAREFHAQALPELSLFLEARKITALYHFTPLQNVVSIFNYGILGRDDLRARGINYKVSDANRVDPIANGICISLTKPNDYMLSRKLSQGYHMALLELKPVAKILQEFCFIASPGNFGRSDHKNRVLSWPEKYCGGQGLVNLFLNENLRNKYKLAPSQPTDPQSELIFLDSIPSHFIARVILPAKREYADNEVVRELVRKLPKGSLIESQNSSEFPEIKWSDNKRAEEFEERKWRIEWEADLN
jgi:hypothetical protein